MSDCTHHEAIEVRLTHLEEAVESVKKMFWAILITMIMVMSGIYGPMIKDAYLHVNGTASASQLEGE